MLRWSHRSRSWNESDPRGHVPPQPGDTIVVFTVCRWRHCAILSTAAAQYHASRRSVGPPVSARCRRRCRRCRHVIVWGACACVRVWGICVYVLCVRDRIFFRVRGPVCVCACVCMYACARTACVPCVSVCVCVPSARCGKQKLSDFSFFRHRSYFGEVRIVTDKTNDTVYVRRPPVVRRSVALSQSDRPTAVARRRPAVSQTATDLSGEPRCGRRPRTNALYRGEWPEEVSRYCGFFAPIPRSCTTPPIDRPPLFLRLGFVSKQTKNRLDRGRNRRRWRRRRRLLIFAGRHHRLGWFSDFLDDSPPPLGFPLARPSSSTSVILITRVLRGFDLYLHPYLTTRP